MHIARFDDSNPKREQLLLTHLRNVSQYSEEQCAVKQLSPICKLLGLIHDIGKFSPEFQKYIRNQQLNISKNQKKILHSLQGALWLSQLNTAKEVYLQFLLEIIQNVALSHHGVRDTVNENGLVREQVKKRYFEQYPLSFKEICQNADEIQDEINNLLEECKSSIKSILIELLSFLKSQEENRFGKASFYHGMIFRFLLSVLVDADRTDAFCFENKLPLPIIQSAPGLVPLWERLSQNLEIQLHKKFRTRFEIDKYRNEISARCKEKAFAPRGVYRLVVPTGAGKTISALRFGINHAYYHKCQRLLYVAPFNSILEQNADNMRQILGDNNVILEHHSNIINDNEKIPNDLNQVDANDNKFFSATENWDSPIVATSAVQFLNTLFSCKMSSIRRFHSLSNSVIIIDEVQALPIKCIGLFNLAMNFLTVICKSTVVLCSATQPPLDRMSQNCIISPDYLIENHDKYNNAFKRVQVFDNTFDSGYTCESLSKFAWDKINDLNGYRSMLIVLNTKKCARNVFEHLYKENKQRPSHLKYNLFHLSTNMCPKHRKEVFNKIKECITKQVPIICVSTQLIEAGVDLSFCIVIRSLAGLDSILQSAGRCNRNGEYDTGYVYIVNVNQSEENVNMLADIKIAQDVMRGLLDDFKRHPEYFNMDLFSNKAINHYYQKYFIEREDEMSFPLPQYDSNMIDLLSDKCLSKTTDKTSAYMVQAFHTAGQAFEVISDDYNNSAIVVYDKTCKMLLEEISKTNTITKEMLRRLQPYTISVSDWDKSNFPGLFDETSCPGIVLLNMVYYHTEIGLSDLSNSGIIL